ncbi:MAG TPA: hypothetical protein VF077_06195 [Nitrospiraceae bacterium]
MKKPVSMDRFSKMGVAAMVPGMAYMLELMQEQLDGMRRLLSGDVEPQSQNVESTPKQLGDGSGKRKYAGGPKGYWAAMTADERAAEMQRRMAQRKAAVAPKGYMTTAQVSKQLGVNTPMVRILAERHGLEVMRGEAQGNAKPNIYLRVADVKLLAATVRTKVNHDTAE